MQTLDWAIAQSKIFCWNLFISSIFDWKKETCMIFLRFTTVNLITMDVIWNCLDLFRRNCYFRTFCNLLLFSLFLIWRLKCVLVNSFWQVIFTWTDFHHTLSHILYEIYIIYIIHGNVQRHGIWIKRYKSIFVKYGKIRQWFYE